MLSEWDIHACRDGYVLRYDGEIVETFPTWEGVAKGRRSAILGQYMLAAALNATRERRAA